VEHRFVPRFLEREEGSVDKMAKIHVGEMLEEYLKRHPASQ
jgi:hypothetical protein